MLVGLLMPSFSITFCTFLLSFWHYKMAQIAFCCKTMCCSLYYGCWDCGMIITARCLCPEVQTNTEFIASLRMVQCLPGAAGRGCSGGERRMVRSHAKCTRVSTNIPDKRPVKCTVGGVHTGGRWLHIHCTAVCSTANLQPADLQILTTQKPCR